MPGKSTPFTPSSILFRPRDGGVAGYCPRVRKVYYDARLLQEPACAGTKEYKRKRLSKKDRRRGPGGEVTGRKISLPLGKFNDFREGSWIAAAVLRPKLRKWRSGCGRRGGAACPIATCPTNCGRPRSPRLMRRRRRIT